MAPGRGFEPLRAKDPLANLSFSFSPLYTYLDFEASAITTPPPRLEYKDYVTVIKRFHFLRTILFGV